MTIDTLNSLIKEHPSEGCIDGILFDLDGTLIDTAPDFVTTVNRLLHEEGRAPLAAEKIRQHVSAGARALVQLAFNLTETSPDVEPLRVRFLDIYERNIAEASQLFDGLETLLEKLDQASIPWGVVTNKPAHLAEKLMQALNLLDRCHTLICPEHVKERKPAPESLFLACKEIQCRPERCIYIGDHERDISAGHNAGMMTIGALYGYIPDDHNPREWNAHIYTHNPSELEAVIKKQLTRPLIT